MCFCLIGVTKYISIKNHKTFSYEKSGFNKSLLKLLQEIFIFCAPLAPRLGRIEPENMLKPSLDICEASLK